MDTIEIKFRGMFEGQTDVIESVKNTVTKIYEAIEDGIKGAGQSDVFKTIISELQKVKTAAQDINKAIGESTKTLDANLKKSQQGIDKNLKDLYKTWEAIVNSMSKEIPIPLQDQILALGIQIEELGRKYSKIGAGGNIISPIGMPVISTELADTSMASLKNLTLESNKLYHQLQEIASIKIVKGDEFDAITARVQAMEAEVNKAIQSLSRIGTVGIVDKLSMDIIGLSEGAKTLSQSYNKLIIEEQNLTKKFQEGKISSEEYSKQMLDIKNQQETLRETAVKLQIQLQNTFKEVKADRQTAQLEAVRAEYKRLEVELGKLGTTEIETGQRTEILQRQMRLLKEEVKLNSGAAKELDEIYRKKKETLKGITAAPTVPKVAKETGWEEYQRLEATLKKLGTTSVESASKVQILQRQLQLLKEEVKTNTGNALELDDAYRKKAASLKEVSKAVKETESIFGRYGMNLKQIIKWQLEWYLGAGLIWGAFFKIRDAISEFIEYSQGLTDVGAITMSTTEELKEMDKVVRQVATSSTMGFKAGADALRTMGQAGMTAADAMKSLNTVAMLTTASGEETGEVVNLLTTAMNVWNISSEKAAYAGNALAAALVYSKLKIGDLGVAFNYVAAQSRLMGYSLESTLGMVAQLAQMGVKASTIGTGLSQFMGSLLAPSKRFQESLGKIGLSIKDLRDTSGNILPFVEVIRKLEKAGMDVATVFEGLEKREARNLANALASGADSFKNMTDAITGTNAMTVIFNKQMEGIKNRLILLKNQTLELVFAFMSKLEPAIKGTIGVLSNFMTGLKEVGPMILGLTTAFLGWKVVAGIIAAINKEMAVMAGMNAIVAASNVQLSKMAVLWTLLSKHPFMLIATAIIATITAIGFLKNSLDKTKQAQDSFNKSMEQSMQVYQNVADINRYVSLLKNENVTMETKNGLLKKLQEIMPNIVSLHADLKDVIKDLKDENSKLNGAIAERIRLFQIESIEAQIPGIQKVIDTYHALYLTQKNLLDLQKTPAVPFGKDTSEYVDILDTKIKKFFSEGNLRKTNKEFKDLQPQIEQTVDSIAKAMLKGGDAFKIYKEKLKIPQELWDFINLQADLLKMEEEKAKRPPLPKTDNDAIKERVNLADLEAKLAEKRFQGVEKQLKAENDVNGVLETQLGIGLSLIRIEERKNREKILLSKESKKVKDIELELLNADIENKRQGLFDKYISAKSKSIDNQSKEEIGDIKDKEKAEDRAYNRSLKFIDLVIDEYAKLDDMVAVELKYKEKIAKIDEDTARRVKERKGIYEEEKGGIEKQITALEQTEGLFKTEQKDKLLKELKDKEKDYNADILVLKQKGIDDREMAEEAGASKEKAIKERLLNEKLAIEKRLSKALKTEKELDLQVAVDTYNRDLEFYNKLLKNHLISDKEYFDKKRALQLGYERVTKDTVYKERDYARKTNQQAMQDAGTFDEYMKAKMESMKNTTYDTWEDIGNATESAYKNMSDTISDIFFDGMKGELDSLGDYFKRFSDYVLKLLTDMAAKWLIFGTGGTGIGGGLVGLVGNLLSGIGSGGGSGGGGGGGGGSTEVISVSSGGFIKGAGGGKDDKIPAHLSNEEYVINADSTGQFKPLLDVINFGTQGVKNKLKDFLGLMSGSADFKVQHATDFEFAGAGQGIGSMSIYVPIHADISNKSKSGLRGDMEEEMRKVALKVLRKHI